MSAEAPNSKIVNPAPEIGLVRGLLAGVLVRNDYTLEEINSVHKGTLDRIPKADRQAFDAARADIEKHGCFDEHRVTKGKPELAQYFFCLPADAPLKEYVLAELKAVAPVPLFTRTADKIVAKPVHWLWPDRLPRGKLIVFVGEPGEGKSRLTINIAATLSKMGYWPAKEGQAEIAETLIANFEDDPADTTIPRLKAEGAQLELIHILDAVPSDKGPQMFDVSRDAERVGNFIDQHPDVRLVILDPISACMGDIDTNSNSKVRAYLAPITAMAIKYNVCVIAVTHLTKGQGQKAMNRVMGSVAFTAAARAVFMVTKDKDDQEGKTTLFLPVKNSNAAMGTGLSFHTEVVKLPDSGSPLAPGGIYAPRIVWSDTAITTTADDALEAMAQDKGALEEAMGWLKDFLSRGPILSSDVFKESRKAGHSDITLRRAQKKLGIVSKPRGTSGRYSWGFDDGEDEIIAPPLTRSDHLDHHDQPLIFSTT